MKLNNLLKLVTCVAVCEGAGIIGSIVTIPSIPTWYAGLVKPMLNPPAWVFGPVWTILYAMMGVSLFLFWEKLSVVRKNKKMMRVWQIGYGMFAVQLALNIRWSVIFFKLHNIGGAFIEIIFLWFAILATVFAFEKISRTAASLLLPYLLWVTFAAYLNFSLWMLN